MWRWLKRNRRGLSYALFSLWLFSQIVHAVADHHAYVEEQRRWNEPATVSGFVWHLTDEIAENWQSEFLQVLAFVVLTIHLRHEGSPQSKDGDERMERKLDENGAAIRALGHQVAQLTRYLAEKK
jgi:hypothetical protein